MTQAKTVFLALILFAGLFLCFKIGAAPLFEPDEGRYADVSQTMVSSGDYLVPRKNGFIHFHKPPVTYWAMALSQKVFGSNERGVRLPNALFGLGIFLLVVGIARRIFDAERSFLAGMILLTIPLFAIMARLATTDIGMLFWVTLAVFFFISYQKTNRWFFLILTYASLGLAMLTKGPVGLLLYIFAVIPFLIFQREKKGFALTLHLLGLLVFLGVGLSWYLLVIRKYPGLVDYLLFFQTAERVSGSKHHFQNFFYFVPVLIGTFFPWVFFIPAALQDAFSKTREDLERRKILWLALWAALIFVFFSLISSKLSSYILPISVPLAIWMGDYFFRKITAGKGAPDRFFYVTAGIIAFIFWAGGIGLGIYAKFFLHERMLGLGTSFFIAAFLLPIAGIVLAFFVQTKRAFAVFSTLFVTMTLVAMTFWMGLERIGSYKTVKPFAEKIIALRKPGEPVIAYRNLFSGLPFYMKERVIVIATKTEHSFDTPEEMKEYSYKDAESVASFIKSKKRCFIVSKSSDAKELRELYGDRLKEIFHDPKVYLYSNQ